MSESAKFWMVGSALLAVFLAFPPESGNSVDQMQGWAAIIPAEGGPQSVLSLAVGALAATMFYFWGLRRGKLGRSHQNPALQTGSLRLSENKQNDGQAAVTNLDEALAYCETHPDIKDIHLTPNQLRALLEERAQDLESLLLKERAHLMGLLVAGIAHEVANPIGYVTVSTENMQADMVKFQQFLFQMMGDEADEELTSEFKARLKPIDSHMEIILDGCDRIRQLTRIMQNFARTQSKKKLVRIAELCDNIVGIMLPRFKRQVEYQILGERDLLVACRASQVGQALLSIILNSCQAIARKQEATGIQTVGLIQITIANRGTCHEVQIQDNGDGIKGPDQERVFLHGFQGHNAKGNGMGLPLARRVMEEHGGHISLSSTENQSTTITLVFPVETNLVTTEG